jgi:protein TonB
MTSALLYQPKSQWRTCAAFAAAVLIHFAAIALANVQQSEPVTAGPPVDDFPPVTFEDPGPLPDPAPPDVVEPDVTAPPSNESFPEETSTPPPVRRVPSNRTTPIVRPTTNRSPGSLTWASAKVYAVTAPKPEYPYEARRQKITGDGFVTLTIDSTTGNVTSVVIRRSTGNAFLDNAALSGFRRWRFRPGTVLTVSCPITFTLAGASY